MSLACARFTLHLTHCVISANPRNALGAAITSQFMDKYCTFRSGSLADLELALNQFCFKAEADESPLLIYLDMTKMGRLSITDLDVAMNFMKAGLHRCPSMAMGFVMAPALVSTRAQGGARGDIRTGFNYYLSRLSVMIGSPPHRFCKTQPAQNRRVEDKAENKGIWTEMVAIRMDSPPTTKAVPVHMMGWLMFAEQVSQDWEKNIFSRHPCLMFQDRPL